MNMSADQKTLQFAGTDSCRTSEEPDGVEMGRALPPRHGGRESLKASRSPLGGRLVTLRRKALGIQRNKGRGKSNHKDDVKEEGRKRKWLAVIFSLLQRDTGC